MTMAPPKAKVSKRSASTLAAEMPSKKQKREPTDGQGANMATTNETAGEKKKSRLIVKLVYSKPRLIVKLKYSKPKSGSSGGLSVELVAAYKRNAKESPLLRLPGELRNQVYGYVFDERLEVEPWISNNRKPGSKVATCRLQCGPYNDREKSFEKWDNLLSLTRVCRQLRVETELMPYKLSTFQICKEDDFNTFLEQLPKEKKNAIATVSFGSSWLFEYLAYEGQVPQLLYGCKGLKTVIMHFTLPDHPREMVQKFAEVKRLELVEENEGKEKARRCYEAELDRSMDEYLWLEAQAENGEYDELEGTAYSKEDFFF